MSGEAFLDILRQEGFEQIGQLNYRLNMSVWWNSSPDYRMQVLVLDIGDGFLVKADKSYYLKSVSEAGETWARDIGLLHEYLENHFPEIRIAFSHFRDVPAALAETEVRRRLTLQAPTAVFPTIEEVADLQHRLYAKQCELRSDEAMTALAGNGGDTLTAYLRQRGRVQQTAVQQLENQYQRRKEKLDLLHHLQHEYRRKGSAAVYTFSISSSLQVAHGIGQFQDALRAVVKEIRDQHRYHVTQKLQGGRLNIQLGEAEDPSIAWIEQWAGGTLSPTQLQKLNLTNPLSAAGHDHVIVTPDESIIVNGHVQAAEKRLAARVVSTVMARLDKTSPDGTAVLKDPESLPADIMPLRIGLRTDGNGAAIGPAVLPLAQIVHVSGTTGSGKSFLARVLVEEASAQEGLSVLVLDPRNQFVGLLVPEDRQHVLDRYDKFGLSTNDARGLSFEYFAPAHPDLSPPLKDFAALAVGRSIVSFKGLSDQGRCTLAAEILNGVFAAASWHEADRPRLLILVDESQLLLRKRVDDDAKDAAAQSEIALDRIAREGRKYGIVLVVVSQSMKDFSHELATVRQMTNTKMFLRNSDRETGGCW
jgi:hypothetical protein